MREFLNQAGAKRTRLFIPVVEFGLTEFTISVRQIVSKPHLNLRGTFRLSRGTQGGVLGSPELQPVSSRRGGRVPTLQRERGALVARLICPSPGQF